MIDDLAKNWLDAKSAEQTATDRRRELEDKLLLLAGIAENMEGTENVKTDGGYKIKITGRMSRKVDADRIQDIAAEEGSTEHLSSLFRWKPELNMTAWKNADKSITDPLLGGITTKPGRASFQITQE
jgi:hypothetical protein|tara:strand:+ start:224 stop:604 length:381 start_codon:yes stop_codon:yes gene_type:complete